MKYQKICIAVKCSGGPLIWSINESYATNIPSLEICLTQAVNKSGINLPHSVEDIMNRWILQMGFPVVTINTKNGAITQKHFLLNSDSEVTTPSEFK